jgi:acyl carrier protein
MSDQNTTQRINDILVDQLGIDLENIKPESNLASDLGADSLDFVELIMAVEEEFDVEISDEEAEGIHTVQKIIDLVDSKK